MQKLDAYIGRTVAAAMVLVLMVFVGLDLLSAFREQLQDVDGHYTVSAALRYVLLTMPGSIYEFLPYAALVGCLAGLGSLAGNSELVVMWAAGISRLRLIWAVLKPAILLILAGLGIAEYVAPAMQQAAEAGRAMALQEDSSIGARYGVWHREGPRYMHFNAIESDGVLHGVLIYQFDAQRKLDSVTFARRARFSSEHSSQAGWLLEDGSESLFKPDGVSQTVFSQRPLQTELTPSLLNILALAPGDLSISGIWRYAKYLQAKGVSGSSYELTFWRKLLQPLAIVALVLVAISFVFGPLREATMGFRVFVGVMVGIAFRTVQELLGPASLVYGFEPLIATLIPIGLCLLLGVALLYRRT